ncbi:MAG: recombination protein RecR [Candidatus Omnitrophota bacterium]|nr:MAG: recombination protein RecR [Candidatus Omnitrophota bacterium]
MATYTKALNRLIEEFARLPGIGPKSAERLALHILKGTLDEAKAFAYAVVRAKQSLNYCKACHNLSEEELCSVCQDLQRDKKTVCVVEEPKDVMAIEKSGTYKGVYHVLSGAISPLDGRGPEDLKIKELLSRIKQNGVREIIIATDSDAQGETTALYLARVIKRMGVKATRIACGIPAGGNLEYADQATLSRALAGRQIL